MATTTQTLETTLDRWYSDENIQLYPAGTTPDRLTHTYTPERKGEDGKPMQFDRVGELLSSLRSDVESWYIQKTGQPKMDTYNLADLANDVRKKFYGDERFKEALMLLGIDWNQHHKKITIPWWNEIIAGELSHKVKEDGTIHATYGPGHSYETQLMRAGIERSIRDVGIDGVVLAAPDEESPEGYVVVGIRGGESYPNCRHLVGTGKLKASKEFMSGKESIWDIYFRQELGPELWEGIGKDITSATVFARTHDHMINRGNPTYLFLIKLALTREEVRKKWRENKDPDKAEHKEIEFIPANPQAIRGYLAKYYRGKVENRKNRKEEEEYILGPGAMDLAAFAGMKPSKLGEFHKENEKGW